MLLASLPACPQGRAYALAGRPGIFFYPMALLRFVLWTQATYILITAVWPLLDIDSFMQVTGYKTDIWLVKTVGALLIPIAATLYMHLFIRTDHRPAIALGSLTAFAFIFIDLYYSFNDVISDIYLADALVEFFFLIFWLLVAFSRKVIGH